MHIKKIFAKFQIFVENSFRHNSRAIMATYTYKKVENRDVVLGKVDTPEYKYWNTLKVSFR